MTDRKKKCYYCGDPTSNRPDPMNAPASPVTMTKCIQWQNRPFIHRMVTVCTSCREQLASVAKIVQRLKPGENDVPE